MKKFEALLILLFCAIMLSGWGWTENPKEEAKAIMLHMAYAKDYRTGLCFTSHSFDDSLNYNHLTNVPCTPAVEALLLNKRK